MKIQNLILKGGSPESTTETLTKTKKPAGLSKHLLEQQTSSAEPMEDNGTTAHGIVSPFGLPKKWGQNENGGATIFGGLKTKEDEKEHYNFLNEMRVRLKVDESKIIDLEARISCKYKPIFNKGWHLHF